MPKISSYSFGRISIDGKDYTSDVIIYADRVDGSWWRKVGHSLCKADIVDIIKKKPEVLIVGCGSSGCLEVPQEMKEYIKSIGIELIAQNTHKACNIYNELSKSKDVVAALHLTC